ncbi:MAG: hypothetical protein AAFQ82_01100 [Myxococcota bacterium]
MVISNLIKVAAALSITALLALLAPASSLEGIATQMTILSADFGRNLILGMGGVFLLLGAGRAVVENVVE